MSSYGRYLIEQMTRAMLVAALGVLLRELVGMIQRYPDIEQEYHS